MNTAKKGWVPLTAACHTETCERRYRDGTITVENVTPVYRWEEREAVRESVEETLYEVFCKYAPS